jgi:hypothetical protein
VLEDRVLRGIFGPEREEVLGWRKLHNEELHNLCSMPHVIRMIRTTRGRCAVHVTCMEEKCIQSFGKKT